MWPFNTFSYFTGDRNKNTFTPTTSKNNISNNNEKNLSYNDVRNIFYSNPLGQRIVLLPIQLGLSGVRHNIPEEYNINIDDYIPIVTKFCRNVRLYGIGVMFPITKDDDISNPLLTTKLYDKKLRFNITDPLNTTINICNDVTSYNYMNVDNISVNGKFIHKNRMLCLTNGKTQLFLEYSNSSLTFAGQSVYAGIYPVINLLNSAICAIERMLLNSSVLILSQDGESLNSNITDQILQDQATLIQDVKLNSVVVLKNGYKLEQMQIGNLDSIAQIFDNINNLLSLSAGDIPPQIFLGEKLSSSFAEGSAEITQLQTYLSNVRNELITPALKFVLTYAIYNKVNDITVAEQLVDNLEITYMNMNNKDDIIDNADELIATGAANSEDIKEMALES